MDASNTKQETRIGSLRLVRKIAAGGMAEVWEARKEGLEGFSKRLAVKVILPHLTQNEDFIKMFLDEGRLAASLDHPNICHIMDLGEEDGTYYMSMEYIDGVVLSAILRETSKRGIYVPFEHCCQLAIGACEGLDYAHSAKDHAGEPLNLVHRDISPQNIMVSYDGNVKVVDFGIAKAATQLHHTRAGVLKGKYSYMSPEQATGEALDRRSDVFAMGIVMWELTTGNRLFRADNEIATLHKIIGGDYEPPSAYRDGYPPELELIIMKALAMDPNDRFQNCGEMQLAIEDFLLRHGMAAGSKRLAYYVRWLLSDEEMPDLSNSSISSVGMAIESSDSGALTPSGHRISPLSVSRAAPDISSKATVPAEVPVIAHSAPTEHLPAFSETGIPLDLGTPPHRRKRGGGGGWVILLLLLLVGGGVGAYFWSQSQVATPLHPWVIQSEPRGATVFLNGEKVGTTQGSFYVRIGKSYALRLVKPGYKEVNRFFKEVKLEQVSQALKIKLTAEKVAKKHGFVSLTVKPDSAKVTLDGKPLSGSTTAGLLLINTRVSANTSHTLLVEAPKFETHKEVFEIKPDIQKGLTILLKKATHRGRRPRRRRRRVRPRPARRRVLAMMPSRRAVVVIHPGQVRVTSTPPGAIVKIDGRIVGSTPMGGFVEVTQGKPHLIRVEKEKHRVFQKTVLLRPKQKRTLHARLRPLRVSKPSSYVYFGASPRSDVFINGRRIGRTPVMRHQIPSGRYAVEFRTAKFQASYKKRLTFGPGTQRFFHRFQKGRLWVLTRTIAKVFVGQDFLGKSRQPPYTMPVGTYNVRVVFPGGKSVTRRVRVTPGRKTTLRIIQ